MKPYRKKISQWMGAALAGAFMQAAGAQALDVPLGTPDGFQATRIDEVGANRYCISGRVTDDMGGSESAMAVLVDAARRTVLWKTSIPRGRDYVGNSAVACAAAGDAYYVASQENTHTEASENQTRVVVSRISSAGKLEKQQTIEAGFDEWFYGLDASAAGVAVVGGTSGSLDRNGPFGTFVARLDPQLGAPKLARLNSGAFWVGSNARLDGTHLTVSGQFMPNAGAGRDAMAVSKIDVDSGKYVWSTYALPGDAKSGRSWLAADGGVVTVGVTDKGLAVAAVDRAGKVTAAFQGGRALCTIAAVAPAGKGFAAIGKRCDDMTKLALVPIDVAAHTVGAARTLGELSAARVDGNGWMAVRDGKHGMSLQRGE